ncbi:hypothetical protein NDU88_002319 [Pleurodeles waltl]|uniref:Uncharacterized protein n=1 Tax=Pleurodeles waltl TaxID=8319 RepID=A0AAV7MMA4_PLEWA|nr:hypothetical protein NDU88_002319 [Pleurodeles waltl]
MTTHTAILFLAGEPPGTGWRYGLSESPMAAQQAAPPCGIPRVAENRRETAGFPLLTAEKPLRSEYPAGHRQPVDGAPADPGPGETSDERCDSCLGFMHSVLPSDRPPLSFCFSDES